LKNLRKKKRNNAPFRKKDLVAKSNQVFFFLMEKQIADAHEDVEGTEAIDHEHFRMGNAGLEAVGNRKALENVSSGAAEIGNGLQNVIKVVKKERGKE
jgi:hypothetical protein